MLPCFCLHYAPTRGASRFHVTRFISLRHAVIVTLLLAFDCCHYAVCQLRLHAAADDYADTLPLLRHDIYAAPSPASLILRHASLMLPLLRCR